ncbi:glutamine amidotransferase [Brachybacterium endophyticum]|uniref:Glutamine amidotransferase n=1 Tax=Brachybacterium endophyticum TaxID=2182385 RepID=A0A2U2RN83_9MICO|nr:glutamine amidotransferase [Brachybacterium endophyticum]PWH07301.1 glutamine amidotransferase [Brachybacterium endophyticum]
MKPFLLIATRPEDEVAASEYEATLRLTGLAPEQLHHLQLDRTPMPEIDLEDISGIIVGGSPYNTSDEADTKSEDQKRAERELGELLDRVVEADFPFFGACYGVGTLGVHQGAIVDRTYGEPVGGIDVELTAAGREDPLVKASGVPDSFLAFVGHKEAVHVLPAHAVLLATGQRCPVQMFRVGSCQYATQFHPELDNDGLIGRIHAYRDNGYFDPAEEEALIERVSPVDVHHAAKLLRAFVEVHAR